MSTLEATVSMLQAMPEEARLKVLEYTRRLFTAPKPANPFSPVGEKELLADLSAAREEIDEGKGMGSAAAELAPTATEQEARKLVENLAYQAKRALRAVLEQEGIHAGLS